MVLVTALAAHCKQANIPLSDYLAAVFAESYITATCDVRADITYYNESEPNPEKLQAAKREGEAKRDKNDLFFPRYRDSTPRWENRHGTSTYYPFRRASGA